MSDEEPKQLLHLVFGGKLTSPDEMTFVSTDELDLVGIYPNYAEALSAWRGATGRTVDDAHMRYFVCHLHRLLEPEDDED